MHMIVVGGGRTGRSFAERAIVNNHQVVIVEQDAERAQALSSDFDCLVINADAASREIMEEAGLDRADAVVATTRNDSVNLMVALMASQRDVEWIVSTLEDDRHRNLFDHMGAAAVESPQRLTGQILYDRIARPKVQDFMELSNGVEIQEVEVTESGEVVGQSLAELVENGLIGQHTIVVAIVRSGEVIVPKGGTSLEVDDTVTLLTQTHRSEDVSRYF